MAKIKIGIIGCGTIANSAHIPAYMANPDVEIKYFCDILPEKAKAAVEKYGCGIAVEDYHDIIADPEVEAADSVEVRNLQDEICFAYDSEEPLAFSIVSNKTWSIAKSNLDWLEVSQMNGGSKYPSTVLLTPSVNDDLERSGILTVYAGATTRRVTIVQEAFPIVPEITLRSGLPDDKTLRFSYTDAAPVTFTIYSNIAWQASTSGLDGWAEVAPLEGARKQETEIVVTPTPNEGDERSGTITFTGEGLEEPLVVNVSQEAVDPTPLLIVSGIKDGQVAFANAPEAPFTFSVQCNRRWEITGENLDWLTVEPSSGRSSLIPVEVALTARDNELYEPLEGRLTLHVYDDAIEDVTITVTQDANKRLLAQWTMDDTVPWKTYNPNFAADGRMKADLPEGTGAVAAWQQVNATVGGNSYTASFKISNDGTAYSFNKIWNDDHLLIYVPVENMGAGAQINIRYSVAMNGSKMPRFWVVEWSAGDGVWTPTSISSFPWLGTSGQNSKNMYFDATYAMPNETAAFSSPYRYIDISETATIPVDIENGALWFRIRCSDATHTSYSSKTERTEAEGPYNGWIFLSGYGRSNTVPAENAISIWQIK